MALTRGDLVRVVKPPFYHKHLFGFYGRITHIHKPPYATYSVRIVGRGIEFDFYEDEVSLIEKGTAKIKKEMGKGE